MTKLTCDDLLKAGKLVNEMLGKAIDAEKEWAKDLGGNGSGKRCERAMLLRAVYKKASRLAGMAWRAHTAHRQARAVEYMARFWAFAEQHA